MKINKLQLVLAILLMSSSVFAQGVRFSFQMGAAIPLGDFAKNDVQLEEDGFANTGFDLKLIGERILDNNFVVGVNIGYTFYGVDEEAIKKIINPSDPDMVIMESQSFQNINLQARGGYYLSFMDEKMSVTPFVDLGIGLFNSAYYAVQLPGGDALIRSGNSAMALLITPGVEFGLSVNDIIGIKVYGNYQFADYSVDEEFKLISSGNTIVSHDAVNYKYSSASLGLGVTFTL